LLNILFGFLSKTSLTMKSETVVTHNTTHEGAGRENILAGVFVLRGGFSSFASFSKGVGHLFVVFSTNKNPRLANVLKAWDKNPDKILRGGFFFYTQERWKKQNILFVGSQSGRTIWNT
jgi:hypothetical protein